MIKDRIDSNFGLVPFGRHSGGQTGVEHCIYRVQGDGYLAVSRTCDVDDIVLHHDLAVLANGARRYPNRVVDIRFPEPSSEIPDGRLLGLEQLSREDRAKFWKAYAGFLDKV